ncbi:regulator of chromosome condensation RCC1 [Paenibacillus mucilaginosus 3016]|uniref:Regulator of chromosome condensation RCC1 n=1 Tax=Paenibacillus mucilaginosus 3016 TaxID=1116391 RepID=H6NFN8_9BACL|nr:S-layer homology domain-containing protein [Paenibacillus mucilaginosus]AFC30678.1 regulator of chromosome condensation RCC1 [Paenibacillus mucilaginosus 3016]
MYRIRFTRRFMNALLAAALVLSPLGGGAPTVLASGNSIGLKVNTYDVLVYKRGDIASISIRGDQLGLPSDADAEELHIQLTYDGDVFDTSNYTVPMLNGGWQYTDPSYYSVGPNLSGNATLDAPIVVDNGDGTYTMDLNIKADDPDHPIQAGSDEVVLDLIMDVKSDAPAVSTSIVFTTVTMKSANGSIITTNQDAGVFSLTDANVSVFLPDDEAVAEDTSGLAIGYAVNESAAGVQSNVTLPPTGENGSTILWSSSDPSVISEAGTVQRPAVGQGNASVDLTAAITKGHVTDTKMFTLTVLEQTLSDAQAVAEAREALSVGYLPGDSAGAVTRNVILPVNALHDTAVTWTSTNADRVDASGTVTRGDTTETVQVTATISKGAVTLEKTFDLTVLMSDAAAVAADKAALLVGLQPNDQTDSVTGDVTLSATGLNGTAITWSSDKTSVISNTGTVVRPSYGTGNAAVVLTATVQKGQAQDTKPFTLTVLEAAQSPSEGSNGGSGSNTESGGGSGGSGDSLSDADAVTLAKEALSVGYLPGDSAGSVTQNVILPLNGLHDTAVTWTSTNADRVDASGTVTRGDTTETVQVTATISKGAVTLEKTFDLTVLMSDAAAVAIDKAALLVGLQPNDQTDSVTGNVTLPATGLNGTTITWSSDKTSVISDTGTVVRPSYSSGNAAVVLTATVQKGQAQETKPFTLTVLKAARKASGGGGGISTSTTTPTTTPTTTTTPAPNPSVPDPTPAPSKPGHAGIFNSSVVKSDNNVKENVLAKVEEAKKAAAPAKVSDTKGHWAQKTFDLFVQLNVIQGYEDGTAKPDQTISRAEFVSILSRLFQVSGDKQVALQDIGGHWANENEAIKQFAAAGVIGGYGDGTFQPDRTISREEIVVIMSRLINMNQLNKNEATGTFQDAGESYAKDTIQAAAEAGIIQGKGPGRFEPKSSSTRAEALQIILNTLNLNSEIATLLDSLES